MAYNKEDLQKALNHFHLDSIDEDILKGNEDKLIFCAENDKKSFDFDNWVRYETLLKEKMSFEEYTSVNEKLGKNPFDVNFSDCDLLHSLRKHLESVRGLDENYLDEDEQGDKTMVVLLIKPDEKPELMVIDGSLESEQKLVGGWIEMLMPFEEEVALICNEEGKINGMPFNRAVRDADGQIIDIMAGNFFICYAPSYSSNFLSLPPELILKYAKMFEHPDEIFMLGGKVFAEPIIDSHDNSFLGIDYKITEKENTFEIDFSIFNEDKCEDVALKHLSFSKENLSKLEIIEIAKEKAAELSIDLAYKSKDEFNKVQTLDAAISSAAEKIKAEPEHQEKDTPEMDLDI